MNRLSNLIADKRKILRENQTKFGKRFGVSATAVSLWEQGKREAGYEVIEFCLKESPPRIICPRCGGKGIVNKFVGEVGYKLNR